MIGWLRRDKGSFYLRFSRNEEISKVMIEKTFEQRLQKATEDDHDGYNEEMRTVKYMFRVTKTEEKTAKLV